MHDETINGLLTQKPTSPPPAIGDIRTYAWEQRISQKTGKPWIKIKSETSEYGGKPCKIISARQTDFVDAHGNLSFNLEIEPVNGAPAHQERPVAAGTVLPYGSPPPSAAKPYSALDERQRAIIRQHSQSMAIETLKLKVTLNELTAEDITPAKLTSLANFFDADCIGAATNE